MKIATFNNPANQVHKLRIEKPLSALFLAISYSHGVANEGQLVTTNILDSVFSDSTLSLNYINKAGNTKRLVPSIPLKALAEFFQTQEGSILINENTIYIPIHIGHEGLVPFNNDEVLEISFNITNPNFSMNQLSIHTIETPQLSPFMYEFDRKSVPQNQKQVEFDISKSENLLIPVDSVTSTTEYLFRASNGQTTRFQKEELIAMAIMSNDLVVSGRMLTTDGIFTPVNVFGYENYFVFPCGVYETVEIVRDSTSSFDIISQMSYVSENALPKSLQKNILIRDVAGERLQRISNQLTQ